MDNCEYFIKDCASCKYSVGSLDCVIVLRDAENGCISCPNCDTSSKSVYGMCNCCKDADTSLEHCPYWRDLDDA